MSELRWWQTAVFYQIYPRSFADLNGDGLGDIPGIISRLDYLKDLGIDALWLSPHFPSPNFDVGYDVADYTAVDPDYGTLDDFRRFLDGAHQRGLRVILDLVLNHTSHLHKWFLESRSSRTGPKRDWYLWRPGRNGGPPNNWYSTFGGSAWEYDAQTGEYYYHFFFKEQPDLNWRNPEVKRAMWEAVRFWLDLGVDGYRLDAIGTIYETPGLPDHPVTQSFAELRQGLNPFTARSDEERQAAFETYHAMFQYQHDLPEVHDLMKELRQVVNAYPDRVLVGETDDIAFYGSGDDELHLNFNFPLMRTERLTPAWIRANQQERLAALPPGAWPCNTLGNHDSPRVLSRYGDGQHDAALARLWLALMLTLKGTPFLYNGEEIGMADYLLDDVGLFHDNLGVWFHQVFAGEAGRPAAEAVKLAAQYGRDKCRTPMQWANAPNGGFSPAGVRTWLPVNPDFARGLNVAEQERDPNSMLNFYRRMLRLRRETPALIAGDYTPLHEKAADYLAFTRRTAGQTCLVILNLSRNAHTLNFDLTPDTARVLFATTRAAGSRQALTGLALAPFEIFIGELAA
jgi:alpha-glucosidase